MSSFSLIGIFNRNEILEYGIIEKCWKVFKIILNIRIQFQQFVFQTMENVYLVHHTMKYLLKLLNILLNK